MDARHIAKGRECNPVCVGKVLSLHGVCRLAEHVAPHVVEDKKVSFEHPVFINSANLTLAKSDDTAPFLESDKVEAVGNGSLWGADVVAAGYIVTWKDAIACHDVAFTIRARRDGKIFSLLR